MTIAHPWIRLIGKIKSIHIPITKQESTKPEEAELGNYCGEHNTTLFTDSEGHVPNSDCEIKSSSVDIHRTQPGINNWLRICLKSLHIRETICSIVPGKESSFWRYLEIVVIVLFLLQITLLNLYVQWIQPKVMKIRLQKEGVIYSSKMIPDQAIDYEFLASTFLVKCHELFELFIE